MEYYFTFATVKKEKIISGIIKLFMTSGIKAVTMDDIAKGLGISKKTVYRYFNSRTDMISEIVDSYIQSDMEARNGLTKTANNCIEEMLNIGSYDSKLFDILSPKTIPDLKQYYPNVWISIIDFQKNHLQKLIVDNIFKGIAEGYYRKDVDAELASRFYVLLILAFIEDTELAKNPEELILMYKELLNYHLSSILSEKGRIEVNKYM